ncbi:hypothetical protein [Bradyrhizobium sp. McL0615]|uniref:hypothetical protein n=1 Tax=Bradyrhizobium sp. McL0615 TaxID=3415673 RepID=UPI003CFB32B0
MKMQFSSIPAWPPLAWCAELDGNDRRLSVRHGHGVETGATWFCEGVWDRPFGDTSFADSDCFFGSGAVLLGKQLSFISSCAPMDRLYHAQVEDTWWVSNSLACLMAQMSAECDSCYATFEEESFKITYGIDDYAQTLKTTKGMVVMTICRNLRFENDNICQVEKNHPRRSFREFEEYIALLESSLKAIAENGQSSARERKYSMLSGISTGYDSPMICALAKRAGLKEAFTFSRARGGADDDGSEIGQHLGLTVHKVDRYAWKKCSFPEVPFVAAVGFASGVELAGVGELLHQKLYLSGCFGDEIWGVGSSAEKIENYKRKEHTGLDISEFRLWAGFLHIPVPYIGYSGLRDILRISKSHEMKEWDVSNTPYEHYSRPIPRRVVEEAGVPRKAFATEKKAATYGDFETNLTKTTLREVYAFNQEHCGRTLVQKYPEKVPFGGWGARTGTKWRRPFAPSLWDHLIFSVVTFVSLALVQIGSKSFRGSGRVRTIGQYVQGLRSYEFSFNQSFPWALRAAMQRYSSDSSELSSLKDNGR